jgi:hypothetical protein
MGIDDALAVMIGRAVGNKRGDVKRKGAAVTCCAVMLNILLPARRPAALEASSRYLLRATQKIPFTAGISARQNGSLN